MRSITFSPAADSDLLGIYRYTICKWGEEQARQHHSALEDTFQKLACNPALLGRTRGGLPAGYYLYHAHHHLIIFRFTDVSVDIARILHERMDVTLHKLG